MTEGKAVRLQKAASAFVARCGRLRARAWPLGGASRRSVLQRDAGSWVRRLDEEKNALVAMVQGTEAEFLATGEGLKGLAQQLNGIQSECQALSELTLGHGRDAAVQYGFQLLKKSEDLVLASDEQYEHVFATFGELQVRLDHLAKQHLELTQVLLPLDFITISIRIEASRHPTEEQQAFFTLAETISQTVNEFRTTMKAQFDELALGERDARRLMDQVFVSIQRHRNEVVDMLKLSRTKLRNLSDVLNGSGANAADLTLRNQAVTRHIGRIVMAQQCQDITRQRIDHVSAAMEEMRAHLSKTPANLASIESDPRTFVLRAAQIQLHQIKSVFHELKCAADSLKSGIQELRADAAASAEAAVKVGNSSLDAEIASQCQVGVGQILEIVKQAVAKTGDVLTAFAPLQARFSDCTRKACELADDVRFAGLNAQVFAINAPNGATLEVLAGRIRVISKEAIQKVENMGAALTYTSELVNNLRQRLEDFQILGQTEREILGSESALSGRKLSDLENAIPLLIASVSEQQSTYVASVEAVLTNVKLPLTVDSASSRSISFFQDLVAWSSAVGVGCDEDLAASMEVERLKAGYTMDSERLAHVTALRDFATPLSESALSLGIKMFNDGPARLSEISDCDNEMALVPAVPLTTVEKSQASEELGDNVELF